MDQTEKPIKPQFPESEEEVHHENGASKMFRKVKARAKKFKNSITKHGQSHEHDHAVVEEDDEDDELEPEVIGAPVRGGVTSQPESMSHPIEANVPAPEKIVPPGTKVFPVLSSDFTKPIEPVSLQDNSIGHEALSDPVRTTDSSDNEQKREELTHYPLGVSELTDGDGSREAHHEPMDNHVSLLSTTEDVTSTFTPDSEDEYLVGQRKVNVKTPKKLEEDPVVPGGGTDYLSGVSNYHQSKVNDLTHEDGEAQVPEITESLGSLKVTDESSDQKSGFERDLLMRNHDAELEKDISIRSNEFDLKTESGVNKNSPTGFTGDLGDKVGEDFPRRSYESDQNTESEINKNSPTVLCSASIVGLGEDFPVKNHELGLKNESGSGKDSPAGFIGESETSLGEDFPAKESNGYGEESESELEKTFPAKCDDVKVETELGRDLTTETHDTLAPEISRSKERDEFEESRYSFEETRDESQESKLSSYTDPIASATSTLSNKAIATKDSVASKLGYSGESPKGDETLVARTFDEILTPTKETGSTVTTELPLSGNGSDLEEKQQEKGVSARDYLAEKLRPGEEDKALSEMVAEEHLGGGEKKTTTKTKEVEVTVEKIFNEKEPEDKENGDTVTEEVKGGGGMVGMIKGWFSGGATEEVKPKSPHSIEESSQSLGSTVGTMGFSDSGTSELRETGGGSGVVTIRRELGN